MFGVVAAELLTGLADERRIELWRLLDGINWVELDRGGWRRVGEASAQLRPSGALTPLTDIAIAIAAITAGAELWAEDVHFDRIAHVLPDLRRFSSR